MKPKLIIFDWDGTLADTTNPIIHTFQQSFADCGLPVPEADQCASEYPSKPAPDMVLALCDRLGVEPEEAVVVGDTTHDLEMAANAKIRAIAVTTGAHTAKQLSALPHVAMLNSLAELPNALETL